MTLTELRYIVAVARERHFGRAAEACFVSQPTLSVAVKKLEEELGVALFERGPGEVTVTPAGHKIVEQAQRVLEEASRIKELAAAGRDPLAGEKGVVAVAVVVCLAALTTMNAAIFTGARTSYALGRDFPALRLLGFWRAGGSTPANALLLQGAVALVLVAASSVTPDGFTAMVAYTAPVFWTFFLLSGLTLFRFRMRGEPSAGFRVPLYPIVPLAFSAACAYMLYSSIAYVGNPDYGPKFGALVLAGLAVMIAGIPLYFLARKP